MSKVLGLDIGTASIGIAISDPLRIIASPVEVIKYKDKSTEEFVLKFEKLIEKYKPIDIVVGLPLNMNGTDSETTKYIREVVILAKEKTSANFHWIDERWTSKAAEKYIAYANVKKTQRKSKNDQVAAALILQIFLESQI